jgi:hypothetical protein
VSALNLGAAHGLDWLAIALALAAVTLLGARDRRGFAAFMASNAAWIGAGLMLQAPAIVVGNIVFFALNLRGWLNWQIREEKLLTSPEKELLA